uniref:C3H1-type domain-containing protein n=1 Tax=Odontella aurita TaxID=265563 RepID=A0A7S4KBR0_9STRA|mmetsp:Transcript_8678/g.26006  ORF Transcript_8678/g.26006 Transcript_8678/m.26006 type:complete len:482 (+) Transcript_8678:98-1543(+)
MCDETYQNSPSLREQFQLWLDTAPPKPRPFAKPTPSQLERLREHGIGYKKWSLGLSLEQRMRVDQWKAEAKVNEKEATCCGSLKKTKACSPRKQNRLDGTSTTITICRHWAKTGGQCMYGEKCKFHHPIELIRCDEVCMAAIDAQGSGPANPHRSRTRANRTNGNRSSVLRRFLLDVYTQPRLRSGSGVVEISAGIHGGVSFELVNLNRVKCTAIEPRGPLRLGKRRKKLCQGVYHKTGPLQGYNDVSFDEMLSKKQQNIDATDGGNNNFVREAPRHWRFFFGPWLFEVPAYDGGCVLQGGFDQHLANSVRLAAKLKGGAATASGHEEGCCCIRGAVGSDDSEDESNDGNEKRVSDNAKHNFSANTNGPLDTTGNDEHQPPPIAAEVVSILRSASILVGLHPDQPTGDIVDLALAMSKPFAVVPCCVFPRQYSKRTLPCGAPVRTYDQLLDWIRAKDERIQTHDLGFGGRSIVLYFDPLTC